MAQLTSEKLAQQAFDLGLLSERQLQDAWSAFGSQSVRPDEFLQYLLRREYLTNYQIERLKKGDRTGFFYGPYRVLYHVGAGTFARVFRAVNQNTNEVVALKVLRNRFSDKPDQFSLFVREGRVGCALRHPNIVRVFDVVSERHTHYLVMEFVEGRNLREFMKVRQKLDPREATRLMVDITQGLLYAFEHGLTHRDMKMSNVLVSSRGQAKLVDFGLAAVDEALGQSLGDVSNSRAIDYAALERATGVRKDDTRSDIYFLGGIYYHMLTGVAPMPETQDRIQRLSKQRFLEIRPIQEVAPTLPNSVVLVVNRAMKLDPTQRYQTPAAMVSDLRIALERLEAESDAGVSTAPASWRPARPAQPSRAVYTIMVIEANPQMQDVLRDGLRRSGYRVLLTADPARAVSRVQEDSASVDCVLIGSQELGETALAVFKDMATDPRTRRVPTLLLLDASQRAWRNRLSPDELHRLVAMPVTLKQVREALEDLLNKSSSPESKIEVGS